MATGDDPVHALAVLEEPRRRELYEHVIASEGPVGRDDAARAVGITRQLAAFHLDRLVAAGLLDVRYRRLNGRTGPGAGRPAKLYQRAARELRASYPPREYGQAAKMLAAAIERLGAEGRASAAEAARSSGRELGAAGRHRQERREARRAWRDALVELLRAASFEPVVAADQETIRLRNCPYHALAAEHRELTCGMNLAWAEGLLDGLGDAGLVARLAPSDDACCVVFAPPDAS
jgi:predicted ArsR family transcriptional regulator